MKKYLLTLILLFGLVSSLGGVVYAEYAIEGVN